MGELVTYRKVWLLKDRSYQNVTHTELQTTSFINSTRVTCSGSVSHDRVQVLSIPVLLLTCSQNWNCNHQMIIFLDA